MLEPPTSEHGAEPHINVAAETRDYQDEVDLVGKGTVKRCKLLLLGNGKSGKTILALNLNPHFDKRQRQLGQHGNNIGGDYVGSTHGIQLWDWPDYVAAAATADMPVNLHMWDFGGQEIYPRYACLIHGSGAHWDRAERNWTAVLRFVLDEQDEHGEPKIPGLGGEISIRITGPQADEGLATLKEFVQSFLPGYKGNPSAAVAALEQETRNCLPGAKTVFFSYAWDPVEGETHYLEPVDAVENALQPLKDRGLIAELLRDKSSMKPGDYLREFIANVGSQDVDLVLVFTSDRYWRKLRSDFVHVLTDDAMIAATIGLAKDWTGDNVDEIIAWVKAKLGIPAEHDEP